MTDHHDGLDDWLGREVQALPPRAGTFERVHREARRRRARKAVLTATAVAAVVAAGVATPLTVDGLLRPPAPGHPVATESQGHTSGTAAPTPTGSGSVNAHGHRIHNRDGLSDTYSGAPAPANFRPTSVTMIGIHIGAVIGQAGYPGHCATRYCTSIAGTADAGASWYGVSAPRTPGPDGPRGVSQIRFLNLNYGWAFGPELWSTADGGRVWTRVPTNGQRVTDLETAGRRAFAVWATCGGAGSRYAQNCTRFRLYSVPAGSTDWRPVPVPSGYAPMSARGQHSSATLAIASNAKNPQAGTGYLLTPEGSILSGPLSGQAWRLAGQARCAPGPARADAQPSDALLVAGAGRLFLSCAGPGHRFTIYWTPATSMAWTPLAPPASGTVTSLTADSGGTVLAATTTGLLVSSGTGYVPATIAGGVPPGGFAYVGMTTDQNGIALPAEPGLHELYVTSDGGNLWVARHIP